MSSKVAHKNDLINLLYGSIVRHTLETYKDDFGECNRQLDEIGFGIGVRLIDEFLIKTESESCKSFKDVIEKVTTAFRLFLGVEARYTQRSETDFSVTFFDNPFDDNVFLPTELRALRYSNVLCGLVRGGLEALNYRANCFFLFDKFSQNRENTGLVLPNYEMAVELVEIIKKKLVNYDE
jgi:hypothetical protein